MHRVLQLPLSIGALRTRQGPWSYKLLDLDESINDHLQIVQIVDGILCEFNAHFSAINTIPKGLDYFCLLSSLISMATFMNLFA